MSRVQELVASLDISLQLIAQLETSMGAELRAIESSDPAQVEKSVAEKLDLITRLEGETALQKSLVEAEQLSFTPDGMAALIATRDPSGAIESRWSTLRAGIARCKKLNETNAQLVERHQRRVALSLEILKGEQASTSTYDPRGRATVDRQRGRTISQA